MSEHLGPLTEIASAVSSVDWAHPTDMDKSKVVDGLCEILKGLYCSASGEKIATDSAITTVWERARAIAIDRRVSVGIRELAAAKGVDVATASRATIITASTADEVNALIAFETRMTREDIEGLVTNEELATINKEEIARNPIICDPGWNKDLTQFVGRISPHGLYRWSQTNGSPGIWVTETVTFKADTIRPTVDRNGEIMSWRYEESVR